MDPRGGTKALIAALVDYAQELEEHRLGGRSVWGALEDHRFQLWSTEQKACAVFVKRNGLVKGFWAMGTYILTMIEDFLRVVK